jgi:hypothetical protein
MKINPSNPYIQKFHNFNYEEWEDEIIKNNPNCIFHLMRIVENNPSSEEDIDRAFRS